MSSINNGSGVLGFILGVAGNEALNHLTRRAKAQKKLMESLEEVSSSGASFAIKAKLTYFILKKFDEKLADNYIKNKNDDSKLVEAVDALISAKEIVDTGKFSKNALSKYIKVYRSAFSLFTVVFLIVSICGYALFHFNWMSMALMYAASTIPYISFEFQYRLEAFPNTADDTRAFSSDAQ